MEEGGGGRREWEGGREVRMTGGQEWVVENLGDGISTSLAARDVTLVTVEAV